MTEKADIIVVGVGGCGASALYHLARRGLRVVGIDRFDPGHDRGSSHGDTRIIRQAYFEHADYVPLLQRAYSLWKELEEDSGASLMNLCGLLMLCPPDGETLTGARFASERYGVPFESLDDKAVRDLHPAFQVPEPFEAAWEPLGGYLAVEDCIRTYANRAVELGATLRIGESVQSFRSTANGVEVETDRNIYSADRLIVSAGAWAPSLLPGIASVANLHVLRKVVAWYPRKNADAPLPQSTFYAELPYGAYYGFPCLDGSTVKIAEHTGGMRVGDPLHLDRSLVPEDTIGPARFVTDFLPSLSSDPVRHAVCMYTMTDDGHFVLDRHPEHDNVVFAAGFSGHGFKFMSAIGAVMAELAVDGETESLIEFLGLGRFSR